MFSTDFLGLSDQKVLKAIRDTLPTDLNTTQNVLVISDGVLFAWDFDSSCVLTLNVRSARSKEGDGGVAYQTLLPTTPPLFTPNRLVVNDEGTLLAAAGPDGILVIELPRKCPPYGAFAGNKEVVYCKSYSLDERLLACNDHVEVRQIRFHPGSRNGNHIVALTSDNVIRLYNIENSEALSLGAYPVGIQPLGFIGGTKSSFLEALGDTAVDFDFGPPEINTTLTQQTQTGLFSSTLNDSVDGGSPRRSALVLVKSGTSTIVRAADVKEFEITHNRSILIREKREERPAWGKLSWPIYVLFGNRNVSVFTLFLYERKKPEFKGPLKVTEEITDFAQGCSILCIKTNPAVICLATTAGVIHHYVVLPSEYDNDSSISPLKRPDRSLYAFETIELELENETNKKQPDYVCPVFLHKDDSTVARYFVTHNNGVHSVNVPSVLELQKFINNKNEESLVDIFKDPSTIEHLICSNNETSEKTNPVVGFSLYYEPASVVALLANGEIVSLALLSSALLPPLESLEICDAEELQSPLKKMLREPFDTYIQKILKPATTQPILKLPPNSDANQQECLELIQKTAAIFRQDYFPHYAKAREEIEKRVKALQMLKKYQQDQIIRLTGEKHELTEKAEALAEKYEDIQDRQEALMKRCERLLLTVSHKKDALSDAEKGYVRELKEAEEKVERYARAIEKVRRKQKYQEIHMQNWKQQQDDKIQVLDPIQANTIKAYMHDMTKKIADLVGQVKEYKKSQNLS